MAGKRGFASMDKEKQRLAASAGGRSVPAEKRVFFKNRELASEAGKLSWSTKKRTDQGRAAKKE